MSVVGWWRSMIDYTKVDARKRHVILGYAASAIEAVKILCL